MATEAPPKDEPQTKTPPADGGKQPQADGGKQPPADGGKAPPADGGKKEDGSLLDGGKAGEKGKEDGSLLDGGKGGKKDPEPKTGAPETYAEPKLPDGVTLNKELWDKATPLFKKHGLSQEVVQDIATLQAEAAKAEVEGHLKEFEQARAKWREDSIKMLGPKWNEEMSFAAKALDRFGGAKGEVKQALKELGIDNHPTIVKLLVDIGKAFGEDRQVEGHGGGQMDDAESTKRALFPSMYPK